MVILSVWVSFMVFFICVLFLPIIRFNLSSNYPATRCLVFSERPSYFASACKVTCRTQRYVVRYCRQQRQALSATLSWVTNKQTNKQTKLCIFAFYENGGYNLKIRSIRLIRVQCMSLSNTALFDGRYMYRIFYTRYNYMFRRLTMAILRLYMKYVLNK